MQSLIKTFTGALRLQTETFEVVKQASDGLWQVLKMVIFVSLIAGLGGCANVFRDEAAIVVREQREALEGFRQLEQVLPSEFAERMTAQTRLQLAIAAEVVQINPPLGRVPSRILKTFGAWLGSPFMALAGWFGYALMVLLVAKLLGGTATLAQHLSLVGLSFAPHVLDLISNIPAGRLVAACGAILAVGAWLWGSIIYVKGIAIANDLDYTRALVAWAVPFVVIMVLVAAVALLSFVLIFVAAAMS